MNENINAANIAIDTTPAPDPAFDTEDPSAVWLRRTVHLTEGGREFDVEALLPVQAGTTDEDEDEGWIDGADVVDEWDRVYVRRGLDGFDALEDESFHGDTPDGYVRLGCTGDPTGIPDYYECAPGRFVLEIPAPDGDTDLESHLRYILEHWFQNVTSCALLG